MSNFFKGSFDICLCVSNSLHISGSNQQTLGKVIHCVALCEHMSNASEKMSNIGFPETIKQQTFFFFLNNIGRLFSGFASKLS